MSSPITYTAGVDGEFARLGESARVGEGLERPRRLD